MPGRVAAMLGAAAMETTPLEALVVIEAEEEEEEEAEGAEVVLGGTAAIDQEITSKICRAPRFCPW